MKYFLKEKLDLVGVMMGLIKNLKTKYNIYVQYLRKRWGWSLNSPPLILHNRMAALNERWLPSSTGYMPSSMVGNSLLS